MIRKIIISLTVLSTVLFGTALPALAFDVFPNSGVDCSQGGTKVSAVCQDQTTDDPISGSNGLLTKITNIVAYIAGAAAVIVIIVSGIRYITAGGNAEAASSARNGLIGALIGLTIIILARTLITYVVKRL
jgi:hypothetical protein